MSTITSHLDRILQPLADCLTAEVAAKVVSLRADDALQARIDDLAERANEGLLADVERVQEYCWYESHQIHEAMGCPRPRSMRDCGCNLRNIRHKERRSKQSHGFERLNPD